MHVPEPPTPNQDEHTVRAFSEELKEASKLITTMGGKVEAQLEAAIGALSKRDSGLADEVIRTDAEIDRLEQQIQSFGIRILALRQPVAKDLRSIISAMKIASDLERIADYAANGAKRALVLNTMVNIEPAQAVIQLGLSVRGLVNDVIDAYVDQDKDKAMQVWHRDAEIDDMHTSVSQEMLRYMMSDSRAIAVCTHHMFIAKNLERIGDHATNIAESIYFLVTGESITESRPKGDQFADYNAIIHTFDEQQAG